MKQPPLFRNEYPVEMKIKKPAFARKGAWGRDALFTGKRFVFTWKARNTKVQTLTRR